MDPIRERRMMAMASRVADRHIEAGPSGWLQWIVQPLEIIWKHHKEFVQGPVDDAMDVVIKELAPELVKAIGEKEVDADVDEFLEGAVNGKWDFEHDLLAAPPSGQTEDYVEGYEWGFANPNQVNPSRGLPSPVRKRVVQEAIRDFRRRITEEVVKKALAKAWDALSPVTTFRAIVGAVKKHGWKLGVVIALVEIVETFVIPGALITLTGDPEWVVAGTLPLSEILYAVVFRVLGRTPGEADNFDPDGHLDWYEAQYGVVRLAALEPPKRTPGFRGGPVPPGVYC
jgi:hypothetical protein